MRIYTKTIIGIYILVTAVFVSNAVSQSPCEPPRPIYNKESINLFSIEQEEFLGEVMSARLRKNYRVIEDRELNEYVDRIGQRIAAHMPESRVKFTFHVADLPEANAFIHAGGYVYVTRKLIAFVKNEDELAGVIAHEMGHGIVRHSTIDYSRLFKEVLGVDSLDGKQDVFDKYNEFIERNRTKKVKFKNDHGQKQQIEADEIGLFAMIAAGYDGKALLDFWDRFTELEGKTGNWFSDFFGNTSPSEKRFREMLGNFKDVPKECKEKRIMEDGQFEKWRRSVINYSGLGKTESLPEVLSRRTLEPPLQPEINHLQFSPDGQYILAQDDGGINVLNVRPFRFLFRIDAPEVRKANFTPDSKNIVFFNNANRVQNWNIALGEAESIHESYIRVSCIQAELSPDGKLIACFDLKYNLNIYDVVTNRPVYTKEKFYEPSFAEFFAWFIFPGRGEIGEKDILTMSFTPDSKYFLAGRKFDSNGNGRFSYDNSEALGVDLETKKKIKLSKNLKNLLYGRFTFASGDRIIGMYGDQHDKSGVFSFPDGERIEEFFLNGKEFTKSPNSDYLLVRPVTNGAVGVYDLKQKKFVLANKTSAMDVFGDIFVSERKTGELGLYKVAGAKLQDQAVLPSSTYGILRSKSVSDDGKWLAVSEKSRGGVWDLSTGERIFHIRGFRNGFFDRDGRMFSDFPKQAEMERSIGIMDTKQRSIDPGIEIKDSRSRLNGSYLISFVPNKNSKNEAGESQNQNDVGALSGFESNDVTLRVRDAITGGVLWQRAFENERPYFRLSDEQDLLTLRWSVSSKTAKQIIAENPELKSKVSKLDDETGDYLVQVIDVKTGNVISQTLIETGEGSFRIQDIQAAGDILVIEDFYNRVLLYSLALDSIKQRFFGENATISPKGDIVVIENEPGHLTVYDIETGEALKELKFTSRVEYVRFLESGSRLFVLTDDQQTFQFDAALLGRKQ